MKICLFILCSVFFPVCGWAVDNLRFPDIRAIGIGGNEVTQSLLYNPSLVALSTVKSVHIESFNRYQLKELTWFSSHFSCPNEWLPFGVNISSFGYDAWRESRFRCFVGKSLGRKWSLGIGIQYHLLQVEGVERALSSLSTDVGATFSLVDNLFIGMLIKDLPSVCLQKNNLDYKPFNNYLLQIGFQWTIINDLLMAVSAGSEKERSLIVHTGIEYTAFDSFHLRMGLQTAPLLPSLGIGYDLLRFSIDIAAQYHSTLGISSGLGITYRF